MSKKFWIILIAACLLISGLLVVNHLKMSSADDSEEPSETLSEEESEVMIYADTEPSETSEEPLANLDDINYIKTLAETEIFDTNNNAIGMMGADQTFAASAVASDQMLKLADLPFHVHYDQIEVVSALQEIDATDLDLSRYLAFEQMIAEGSAVNFYHLDHTFAFRLDEIETDIHIYMQESDHFYISYLDTYFLVAQDDVTLIENPNTLPERTAIPVLMYHFFCNSAEGLECRDNNWIERDHFEEHMQYLRDYNFTTLKMIDLERFLNGSVRLPEQSLIISIDDGHPTVFEHAYPILIETDQVATIFAITERNRDWETLLLSNHLELHSHTHDMHRGHCDMGRGGIMQCIDFDEGVADLKYSQSILNGSTVFAYPFGDYNDHTIAMLQETGFTLAFTTHNGLVTRDLDPLLLPRVRVSTDTHLPQFIFLVNQ